MPPLNKPYYRIFRPGIQRTFTENLYDTMYADDRVSLIRSFYLLLDDLITLFEYIEPTDPNLLVFSHRTYELFLRAATEFETNCKRILQAHNYNRADGRNWDINDYKKVNSATKLNEYKVEWLLWRDSPKFIEPFIEWPAQLSWYRSYNTVKHDRHHSFAEASLENLLKSVSAVFVLLYSQFGIHVFNRTKGQTFMYDSDDVLGRYTTDDSFLAIYSPISWSNDEKYDFDWNLLKTQPAPFQTFTF